MKPHLYFSFLVLGYLLIAGASAWSILFASAVSLLLLRMPQSPGQAGLRFPAIPGPVRAFRIVRNVARFSWDFVVDLTMSNLVIAWDVWTPRDHYAPRIVKVNVQDLTDFETMLLASRITLTPGTLSLDVTEDRRAIVVHVMYPGADIEASLRRPIDLLKEGL